MKKSLAILLALATALSLCACGTVKPLPPSSAEPEQTTLPTDPTDPLPAEPTQEEQNLLYRYASLYETITNSNYAVNLAEAHQCLIEMDKSVIYRWRDTEYAEICINETQINWDIDEVLSNFVCVENVLLYSTYLRQDHLGNTVNFEEYEPLGYYSNGMLRKDSSRNYLTYTMDENGRVIEIQHSINPGYGTAEIISRTTLTYDENGNKVKESVMDRYGDIEQTLYSYDSQNRLVRVDYSEYAGAEFYRYDDEGRLIEREAQTYTSSGKLRLQIIEKFEYDEKGHLKTGVRTQNRYTESYYSEPKLDTYRNDEITYTCDENGNVVKEEIITGDTHYCADYMNGQVDKDIYGPEIREYVYGDYYVYTDDEQSN